MLKYRVVEDVKHMSEDRSLVTVRRVERVTSIKNADFIETAWVGGWPVIVSRDEDWRVGDYGLFFEVDSFLPIEDDRFRWLGCGGDVDGDGVCIVDEGKLSTMADGRSGFRVRTLKLRGQLSQGILMRLDKFRDVRSFVFSDYPLLLPAFDVALPGCGVLPVGVCDIDLSKYLGVVKWEAPIPANLDGLVVGKFPGFIPRTGVERCQNLGDKLWGGSRSGGENDVDDEMRGAEWEVTEKLDGTSMTVYYNGSFDGADEGAVTQYEHVGVCGRNWEFEMSEMSEGGRENLAKNSLVRLAVSSGILDRLKGVRRNVAIQGELIGDGIQGNRYGLKGGHEFGVFNIYDIGEGRYLTPGERYHFFDMYLKDLDGVEHVPLVCVHEWFDVEFTLGIKSIATIIGIELRDVPEMAWQHSSCHCSFLEHMDMDMLLKLADGDSARRRERSPHFVAREGLVFKRGDGKFSFKVLSSEYLLKCGS